MGPNIVNDPTDKSILETKNTMQAVAGYGRKSTFKE